jgi:DNA repair protein RecO (recombination protein O)
MANKTISNFEGYVIRTAAFKENDAMVTVLTPKGPVSFAAKGVLKPTSKNAASCQLLSFSIFSLTEIKPGNYVLAESKCLSSVDGRDSLARLASFSFLAELTSKSILPEEETEVFPWLDAVLKSIDQGFDALTASLIYFAHILVILGYGLDVDECVYCGAKQAIKGVSYAEGGFVCASHVNESTEILDARKLKILRYVFRCGIADLSRISFDKEETQGFFEKLLRYFSDLTGTDIRSGALLLKA